MQHHPQFAPVRLRQCHEFRARVQFLAGMELANDSPAVMQTDPKVTSETSVARKGRGTLPYDPLWHQSGVIYEVHVRAFCDANGDGIGDFRGLTEKLDYLRDLGVTAIWLLPFYPSPLKDDGYDVADYFNVHPQYGTLHDFKTFLRQAHRRGLRVITELIMNHTSDQHPWFQRARRAPPGSRWRDYYVWNETADKYKGVRIIFSDTETSNWTWDPVAKAYFWHRFYSHQPDLNFDHPAVREEMMRVMDFWLDLGVDGLRLDAVPYLFEREGSSCENLTETHDLLKSLRAHIDQKYGDRVLLAEANQWPEDAAAYFGQGRGDECHMAFHFPLMPRLFLALRMEDRVPIVDILEQTPPIPETAQWALFLRNHDELTLEMVTDEERDYMYRMYAQSGRSRLNLGIRRRLAPLVNNDRRRIELLSALLFSLPGTPVIYYGDEIGMGENIYLGDRDGVRTPMQWSADKNAGFSRANPQSLYLPINLDPENHYEAVNVEVQERNPSSLLWWMRRLIALQRRWKAFGRGTVEFLSPENRKILAFIRKAQEETILVVANLSRFVQPVELDLSNYLSMVPVELMGHAEFKPVTEEPYFMTLGPHAFYLFSLEAKASARVESADSPVGAGARPLLKFDYHWREVLSERNQVQLEQALRAWLPSRRWFNGRSRRIKSVHIRETIPVPLEKDSALFAILDVEYAQTEPETYALPLACAFGAEADAVCKDWPPLVIARLSNNQPGQDGVLYDAAACKSFGAKLLETIATRRTIHADGASLAATHTALLRQMRIHGDLNREPAFGQIEQTNSSIVFGNKLILKLYRRLEFGINSDLEISSFLSERKFPATPPVAGSLEMRTAKGEVFVLGLLTEYVPNGKSGWNHALDAVGEFYERVQALPPEKRQAPPVAFSALIQTPAEEPPQLARELIGVYLDQARILGETTAGLHLTLTSEPEDPAFAPERFTPHNQRGLFQSMRNITRQTFRLLSSQLKTLPPALQSKAQQALDLEPDIIHRFRELYARPVEAVRIRVHGDYDLDQILFTGKDFQITDFEGEPDSSLSERRLKHSPLRDVAGMIRSFDYAAHAALAKLKERGVIPESSLAATGAWARYWSRWVSTVFFQAYRKTAGNAPFLPSNEADLQMMLSAYLLRRAISELGFELTNRPQMVPIPLSGIIEFVSVIKTPQLVPLQNAIKG
jgi:maltose alpha-D-glucosyltransferase/alpha-amylase